jgi:hypothetical protein
LGAAFAAGYVTRGDGGGSRAPTRIATSCDAASVLAVIEDWSKASDHYDALDSDVSDKDLNAALDDLIAQEDRLQRTVSHCS